MSQKSSDFENGFSAAVVLMIFAAICFACGYGCGNR
jgi:hypothetical protein